MILFLLIQWDKPFIRISSIQSIINVYIQTMVSAIKIQFLYTEDCESHLGKRRIGISVEHWDFDHRKTQRAFLL